MRRSWIALLVAFGMAGCGGMSDEERFSLTTPGTDDLVVREIEGSAKPPPKKVTPGEVKVIRGWANALRAGRVKQAADFFAVPSTVFDGTNPTRPLPNLNAVRQFNRGLPCGAQLVDAVRGRGWFVIATFRLTDPAAVRRRGQSGAHGVPDREAPHRAVAAPAGPDLAARRQPDLLAGFALKGTWPFRCKTRASCSVGEPGFGVESCLGVAIRPLDRMLRGIPARPALSPPYPAAVDVRPSGTAAGGTTCSGPRSRPVFPRAGEGTRTPGLRLTRSLLYQLSYSGAGGRV
jgi:hypothetical protein